MTEIQDFEWDDTADPLTDEVHDEEQSFPIWAKAIWLPGLPVQRDWQNRDGLPLPGITQTKYEKNQPPASNSEPFAHRFFSLKPGGKDKLYTLVLRRLNSEGQEYDEVYQYKNWNEAIRQKVLDEHSVPKLGPDGKEVYGSLVECPDCHTMALITDRTLDCANCDFVGRGDRVMERNAFTDYQQAEFTALKSRDPVGYDKLFNSGKLLLKGQEAWVYLHGWAEDTGYDRSFGEVRRYLKDITIYPDEKAWQAAKDEAGGNGSTTLSKPSNRPAEWASLSETDFNNFIKGLWDEGKSLAEIADTGKFAGKTVDGGEVDLPQLFKDALGLDLPAPMVKMEMVKS